jgi:hypothetical protein
VFTHLPERSWRAFLELLNSRLTPGGVFVFTTAGRKPVDEMETGRKDVGLPPAAVASVVAEFHRTGFGYHDYPGQSYGITRCSPAWVCRALEALPGLRLIGYVEVGWDARQDVIGCVSQAL